MAPRPKVLASVIAGAVVTIAIWIATAAGAPEPPAAVVAAFVTVIGFLAAYFWPEAVSYDATQDPPK